MKKKKPDLNIEQLENFTKFLLRDLNNVKRRRDKLLSSLRENAEYWREDKQVVNFCNKQIETLNNMFLEKIEG